MEIPFDLAGRWRERFVDALIVTGAGLCATPAVLVCLSAQHFPEGAALWIGLSTSAWTWVLVRALRRFGLVHALWLGPVLGVLNSGTACMFAFTEEPSTFMDALQMFVMGLLFGSMLGSFLGILYGAVIAVCLHRLQRWERSCALDASLRLFGSASLVFAGIAVLHISLDGLATSQMWRIPPETSVLLANALVLWAFLQHARVALWLRALDARYARVGGMLTFTDRSRGPFRAGRHTLGVVGTPERYAVRAVLFAALFGMELSLWQL